MWSLIRHLSRIRQYPSDLSYRMIDNGGTMADWISIQREVEAHGGAKTFTMERLKTVAGVGRLGINVCEEISRELSGLGLGTIPETLPTYQTEQVRIYKRGTHLAEVIDLVLKPSEQNDAKLLNRFGRVIELDHAALATKHASTLAKIKELVSE
jgi:hypothetical protein